MGRQAARRPHPAGGPGPATPTAGTAPGEPGSASAIGPPQAAADSPPAGEPRPAPPTLLLPTPGLPGEPPGFLLDALRAAPVLQAAVAAAPTGMVICDPTLPDCPIVYANPAFHRITGYPPEESLGRNCRFLQGPGTDPAAIAAIRTAIAEARTVDVRMVNYRRDGRRFVNELRISPVFGADGALQYIFGIQQDVTDGIRAERAAQRARRAAERASAEKSDFLAFMSHEVRTPLNGVLGTLSLLTETRLDSEQRAYVETARRCGDTLLWTVNEILDLSRIEAGRLEIEEIPYALDEPVRDVLGLLAAAGAEKGLRLSAVLDPTLPARVTGDPRRLRQGLLNLADNAVKFTAAGGVEIHVRRRTASPAERARGAAGDRLRFEVRDTGCGISARVLGKLFQRYQQADPTTARRHGGSGLGLMICRRLVALMGGEISVESELGQGSVFFFDLPLRPAADDAPAVPLPGMLLAEAPAPSPEAAAPRRPQGTSRGRVLLAEDGEANQLVAAAILRKAGFSVDLVCDGAEAVAAARSASYDVVLMDVRMPGLDGYAATAMIRALEGAAGEVPILALTASAMPGDAERCLAAGMDAHLAKPVDRAALVGAVAALMEKKPRRPRAAEPPAEPGPGHALLGRETLEELRAAVGPGRLPDLVGIFANETLARLRRLATRPPLPLVEEEAHALQSAAGTFGAAKLREAATALEAAAAQGHAAAVEAMLVALPPLVERTLQALSRAVGMPADSAD